MESEAPSANHLLCRGPGPNGESAAWDTRVERIRWKQLLDSLHLYRTTYDGLVFCWNDEVAMLLSYSGLPPRVPTGMRQTLPPEEIANASPATIGDSISLPAADLVKACAQQFGFAHVWDRT